MLRHARALFVVAAIVFLAVLGFVALKSRQPASLRAASAPPVALAPDSPQIVPLAVQEAVSASSSRFADRRAALSQRAAAGDAYAAGELGGVLAACRIYSPKTRESLEEAVVNGVVGGVEPPLIAGETPSAELLLLLLEQSQQELDARCANLGESSWIWKESNKAPALLERAADAGQVQAMLDYARYAFIDLDGAEEILQRADEVRRRKDKARLLLRKALRRGEARALLLLADAYAAGPLEKIDPFAAYVHMSAFFESPEARGWSPRLRELYLQTLGRRLDAQSLAQARERGLQLYRDFQAGTVAP